MLKISYCSSKGPRSDHWIGRRLPLTLCSAAMLNSSRQFNNAVHALRAASAVLMVFAVHLLDSFSTYFFPDCETLNVAMPFIKRFGTFGVELFFVNSGFVIMNSVRKYDLREFLLRRLIRIYPLFASFTLAFFVLSWITSFRSHSGAGAGGRLKYCVKIFF